MLSKNIFSTWGEDKNLSGRFAKLVPPISFVRITEPVKGSHYKP